VSILDPDREIYPNAPLKLVTFELRCAPFELPAATLDGFVAALQEHYPIRGPGLPHLVLGPEGPLASTGGARMFDLDRREAVTLVCATSTRSTKRSSQSLGIGRDTSHQLSRPLCSTLIRLRWNTSRLRSSGAQRDITSYCVMDSCASRLWTRRARL